MQVDEEVAIGREPQQAHPHVVELGQVIHPQGVDGAEEDGSLDQRPGLWAELRGACLELRRSPLEDRLFDVGARPELRERLLGALHKAYFEDGRDIGDQETLLTIAAEIGLDRRALAAALNFPDFRAMIDAQVNEISRSGITGVPFFIFNDAFALSGAQPPEIILQAMRKAEETPVTVGGDE